MKTHTLKRKEGHKGTLASAIRKGEFVGFVWAEDDLPFQQAGVRPSFYEIEEGDEIIVIDNDGNETERAIMN